MIVGWSRKLGRLVELPERPDAMHGTSGVLKVCYPHVGGFAPAPEGMMRAVLEVLAARGGGVAFKPKAEWWDPGAGYAATEEARR